MEKISLSDKLLSATQVCINTNTEMMAILTNLLASGVGANGMKKSHYIRLREDIKKMFKQNSEAINKILQEEE